MWKDPNWTGAEETPFAASVVLAGLGHAVIPLCWPDETGKCACGWNHANLKEIGKAPRVKDGVKAASANKEQIAAWWQAIPNANVGLALAPSGFVMIDPDSPEALAEVEAKGLPATLVRCSKAKAFIYKVPPGTPTVAITKKGESAKIDILTQGYAVVHGQHQTGCKVYLEDPYVGPSDAPEWVLDIIAEYAEEQKARKERVEQQREENFGGPPVNLMAEDLLWWRGEMVIDDTDSVPRPTAEAGGVDRSATLFQIGAILGRANASAKVIADALAERDEALGYGKYAGRKDEAEYWRIAEKVCGSPRPANVPSPSSPTTTGIPLPKPLDPAAFYGLAGEVVETIKPNTESDPAALLLNFLICFGNAAGRGPYAIAEADHHGGNLFVVLVGESAKARKGSATGRIKALFERVDPAWVNTRILSGASSGEGIIWAVRDPIEKTQAVKEKGKYTGEYQTVIDDQGVSDKRMLLVEPEFASVLKVMAREGNTLSNLIRQSWDSGNLRTLTKNSPTVATGAHVSILGHITKDELLRYLNDIEAGNGFANRFLFIWTKRGNILPEGGGEPDYGNLVQRLRDALERAKAMAALERDSETKKAWGAIYEELSEGKPGLFGVVTARAEAQVLRLSVLYAAIDGSDAIKLPHLNAALAVWEYAESSAKHIFGDATGDPIADRILQALQLGELTRTQVNNVFQRHLAAARISQALNFLRSLKRADMRMEETAGRSGEVWFAIS
jgi:hypothetical protein